MFITVEERTSTYTRLSKLGQSHTYTRSCGYAVLRCDSCGEIFRRL